MASASRSAENETPAEFIRDLKRRGGYSARTVIQEVMAAFGMQYATARYHVNKHWGKRK